MTSIAPILIASPVRRSGTTLLQRLLSSAPNTLIYGESSANDLIFYNNIPISKEMVFHPNKDWRNQQLSNVLAGEINDWIPDLMPDIDGYLEAVKQSGLLVLKHYQDFAKANNRPVWGVKLPEWNAFNLVQIQQLLPNCLIIYLVRNLADCLQSAKAIDMVRDFEEAQIFSNTWKQNKEYALQNLQKDRVLHLNYKELIDNSEKVIQELEQFTKASGIQSSVLNKKINTYIDTTRDLEIGYLKPAKLTEAELELVKTFSA